MLPPANPRRRAESLLGGELAVHHRNPPEAAIAERLADLPAVAEVAERAADGDRFEFGVDRQAVVAGGGRAGHHALADALHQGGLQRIPAEGEGQDGDPRAAVGRLIGSEGSFDRCFRVAGDHAGGVAGHRPSGDLGPSGRVGGDDQTSGGHREGLGERVGDPDAVDLHERLLPFRRRFAHQSRRRSKSPPSTADASGRSPGRTGRRGRGDLVRTLEGPPGVDPRLRRADRHRIPRGRCRRGVRADPDDGQVADIPARLVADDQQGVRLPHPQATIGLGVARTMPGAAVRQVDGDWRPEASGQDRLRAGRIPGPRQRHDDDPPSAIEVIDEPQHRLDRGRPFARKRFVEEDRPVSGRLEAFGPGRDDVGLDPAQGPEPIGIGLDPDHRRPEPAEEFRMTAGRTAIESSAHDRDAEFSPSTMRTTRPALPSGTKRPGRSIRRSRSRG